VPEKTFYYTLLPQNEGYQREEVREGEEDPTTGVRKAKERSLSEEEETIASEPKRRAGGIAL